MLASARLLGDASASPIHMEKSEFSTSPTASGTSHEGLVSVVIPTFNRAYCIGNAISSLQQQTYTAWEALIVDDGSTDDTPAVVSELARGDRRVVYHRQANAGVSAARNAGLRLSGGEFVAFLDSDDTWLPWKLEAQIAVLRALPDAGMIWTDMMAIDHRGNTLAERHLRTMYRAYSLVSIDAVFASRATLSQFAPQLTGRLPELANAALYWGDAYTAMLYGSLVHTSTVMMRRSRAISVGFFNEGYRTAEDYDFHLRTCHEGPVAFLDVPSTGYRVEGGVDQLTAGRFGVESARNSLLARQSALARDGGRARLAAAEVNAILARAHGRLATELFDDGSLAEARAEFWQSLKRNPWQPKPLVKALLCSFPAPLVRWLFERSRALRRRLRPAAA
jgi:glycosyltransferase involved in cell wall biosynthesis